MDLTIKELQYQNKPITDTRLELSLKGSNVNHVILNSIRRTILLSLPNFAFNSKNIKIEHNTSAYNNDMLRVRISNMPCLNIPSLELLNDIETLEHGKELNNSDIPVLSMVIDFENKSTDMIPVTTKYAKFFINDKKAPDYPVDFLIVKLKPGEKIKLIATSNIGIPKINDIYASACICAYEYDNENDCIFKLESRGMTNEYEIIRRGCRLLIHKLKSTLEKILNMKIDNPANGRIILEKETFTMGNLITDGLQNHKNIEFAGYKIDHLLLEEAEIKYVTDGKDIKDILKETIAKQVKLFEHAIAQLKK
jgi:DNA-directed RNA polymerase subunit L